MIINLPQLKHLSVYTQTGIKLGKINDINFLVETHSVYQYIVRSNFLGRKYFFIKPSQIIEINNDRIVVEDAVVIEKDKVVAKYNSKILEGVATTEINN